MVKSKVNVTVLNLRNFALKNKKKFYAILSIAVIFIFIFLFFDFGVNPVIMDTIEINSKAIATRAMNSAIADIVESSVVYENLINIVSDDTGHIKLIRANNFEINKLSSSLAQKTEEKILDIGSTGIYIPLGTFTGIPIFVGRGPQIKVKATPIGAVTCLFSSKFENAGINQTNHKIYVKINSNIGVVMPLLSVKFQQQQEVLISESIIVGQVPEVYLYSDNLDNLLNFVPF